MRVNPEKFEPKFGEEGHKEIKSGGKEREKEEGETEEEKLKTSLEQIAEGLRERGIPVNNHCRIDMDSFKDIYSLKEVERDKRTIRAWEEKWYGGLSQEQIEEKRAKKDGEKFEALKTLIFHKFARENFLIVRTSLYDDIENKVDNFILDSKTGNPVCAYDELVGTSGERFEEKQKKIVEINREGGAKLKYGLTLKGNEWAKGTIKNIPIFYLAFPREHLKEAIEKVTPSLDEKTDYEKKMFEYFLALMDSQIKLLKLKSLPKSLTERISKFEKSLLKLKEKETRERSE